MSKWTYQSLHALVVVGGVVDSVDTNGVDAEALELVDVALATSNVGDGVLSIGCATWASQRELACGYGISVPGW
jgi:hypothetical protein